MEAFAWMLVLALLLDAALGEPEWLWGRVPHPIVVGGRMIDWLDRRMNRDTDSATQRRTAGIIALIVMIAAALMTGMLLAGLPFGPVLEVIGGAILLAQTSLTQHVAAVANGLDRGLEQGRAAVSMIVGRDPESLDEPAVARAAIESAAENFSDGVVAPAFWFLIGGLPGILFYKIVNTADSMIGHRTPRHEQFGWAAARLDDLLNLIPARLSALLILIATGSLRGWRTITAEAPRHRSPNAGWPEAAMAVALQIALAGPRRYGGTVVDDHWMNADGRRTVDADDIRQANTHLWRAWAALLGLTLLTGLIL